MQPHLHPPMTPRHRVFLAVTVLIFLTVTGVVIGCDSDDTPTVTAPSGGSGSGTPTRNMTAEQQGRDGLEETDNGTMIRNKGTVALNVRFNYDEPRHYRLNADTAMPSDPANAGSAPARVACGVPATGRANGQCFDNDRSEIQSPPTAYDRGGGSPPSPPVSEPPGGGLTNSNGWDAAWVPRSALCVSESGKGTDDHTVTNNCGREIRILSGCPAAYYEGAGQQGGVTIYEASSLGSRERRNTYWNVITRQSTVGLGILEHGQSAGVGGSLCRQQAESGEPTGPIGGDNSKEIEVIACYTTGNPPRALAHYVPYFLEDVSSVGVGTRNGCYNAFHSRNS